MCFIHVFINVSISMYSSMYSSESISAYIITARACVPRASPSHHNAVRRSGRRGCQIATGYRSTGYHSYGPCAACIAAAVLERISLLGGMVLSRSRTPHRGESVSGPPGPTTIAGDVRLAHIASGSSSCPTYSFNLATCGPEQAPRTPVASNWISNVLSRLLCEDPKPIRLQLPMQEMLRAMVPPLAR